MTGVVVEDGVKHQGNAKSRLNSSACLWKSKQYSKRKQNCSGLAYTFSSTGPFILQTCCSNCIHCPSLKYVHIIFQLFAFVHCLLCSLNFCLIILYLKLCPFFKVWWKCQLYHMAISFNHK